MSEFEEQYEVEIEECWHDSCTSLDRALAAIGPWAATAVPLDEVTEVSSGMVTLLLVAP